MFAGADRANGPLKVKGIRKRDEDAVNARVIEEFLVRILDLRDVIGCCKLLGFCTVARGHCLNNNLRMRFGRVDQGQRAARVNNKHLRACIEVCMPLTRHWLLPKFQTSAHLYSWQAG